MLKGEGNEDGKKISRSNRQKKILNICSTFFVHFFDVVLYDCNMKLRSYTSYVGNVVCAH